MSDRYTPGAGLAAAERTAELVRIAEEQLMQPIPFRLHALEARCRALVAQMEDLQARVSALEAR